MMKTLYELEDSFIGEFPSYTKTSDRRRYELLGKLIGTNQDQGLFIIYHLQKIKNVPGSVCEFGVAQGATSALIANEIRDLHKNILLFDSFAGLSKPTKKDRLINDMWSKGDVLKYEGTMACEKKEVIVRLKEIDFPEDKIHIVKGFIGSSLLKLQLPQAETICFANVDMDLYEPTKYALDFLHTKMPIGGVMIIHDINFFTTGPEIACKEFAIEHRDKYLYRLRGNQLAITKREL